MAAFIGFVLENFTLSFFVIGLIFAAVPLLMRRGTPTAGVIFWTDILIPFAGFLLLYLQRRSRPF